MGVVFQYFAAATRDDAATVVDLPGGPGGQVPMSPEFFDALAAGDRAALRRTMRARLLTSEHGYQVIAVKGVDPTTDLDSLRSVLTGRSRPGKLRSLFAGARQSPVSRLAISAGGSSVWSLDDDLRDALATLPADRLPAAGRAWATSMVRAEPEVFADLLAEMAELGRRATSSGHRLYCWCNG